mmetsp:Transcript_18782/g.40687  ORF Transcript_18782/g.40687 Transcript_18782/m.40687 type:complete len:291 (+) Transcript_18782:1234-2106(+)
MEGIKIGSQRTLQEPFGGYYYCCCDPGNGCSHNMRGGSIIYNVLGPLPTASPTSKPTTATQSSNSLACIQAVINVTTDNYPGETSWTLRNNCGSAYVVENSTVYSIVNKTHSNDYCLPPAEYIFSITDAFGDGICCSEGLGSFSVKYEGDIVASGGDFGSSYSKTFGYCPDGQSPTLSPTIDPDQPPCNQTAIKVDILTDQFPDEIFWTLTNNCGNGYELLSPEYNASETSQKNYYCLPSAEYTFLIEDTYGDGICCSAGFGSYSVMYEGATVASGGDYGSSANTTFGNC